jgi:hypothetical protein
MIHKHILEGSGYVEGDEVAVQREDVQVVLSDEELERSLAAVLKPVLLQFGDTVLCLVGGECNDKLLLILLL